MKRLCDKTLATFFIYMKLKQNNTRIATNEILQKNPFNSALKKKTGYQPFFLASLIASIIKKNNSLTILKQ